MTRGVVEKTTRDPVRRFMGSTARATTRGGVTNTHKQHKMENRIGAAQAP